MTRGTTLETRESDIIVNVPLRMKKRGGRKEVILPAEFTSEDGVFLSQQEALAIAVARAHRWQKLLDEGKFQSVSDLARVIGMDVSQAARLLRLTLLAPDIVEAILMGEEPNGLSLTKLTKSSVPAVWDDQKHLLGFTGS